MTLVTVDWMKIGCLENIYMVVEFKTHTVDAPLIIVVSNGKILFESNAAFTIQGHLLFEKNATQ